MGTGLSHVYPQELVVDSQALKPAESEWTQTAMIAQSPVTMIS